MVGKTLVRRQYNDGWVTISKKKRVKMEDAYVYTLMRVDIDYGDCTSIPVQYAIIADYGNSSSLWMYTDIRLAFRVYRALTVKGYVEEYC